MKERGKAGHSWKGVDSGGGVQAVEGGRVGAGGIADGIGTIPSEDIEDFSDINDINDLANIFNLVNIGHG